MNKAKTLTIAIPLLLSGQGAYALTPWVNGTPAITIYTSGGAAQDKAYEKTVITTLAAPGSLDIFADNEAATNAVGSRWSAYYFTGKSTLPVGLAGKKILLHKRIYGAAGYGVVPVVSNIPLEQLSVVGTKLADWTANGAQSWKRTIDGTNAISTLIKKPSSAGFWVLTQALY